MSVNEIWIYDIIGWGESSAQSVAKAVEAADKKKPLMVRTNSDGGIVTEGYGIYNTLRRHQAGVIVEIDGIAASAASLIAMAGDEIRIADGAFLMIHQSSGGIGGNKEELPGAYDTIIKMLTNVDDTLIRRYSERSGLPVEEVDAMLRAETWFTSEEAVEKKLVDSVFNEARAIPFVEEGRWAYKNVPAALTVSPSIAAECRGMRRVVEKAIAGDNAPLEAKRSSLNRVASEIRLARARLGV